MLTQYWIAKEVTFEDPLIKGDVGFPKVKYIFFESRDEAEAWMVHSQEGVVGKTYAVMTLLDILTKVVNREPLL